MSPALRSRLAVSAAAAAVLAGVIGVAPSAVGAGEPASQMVGMGDSFSSGLGTGTYYQDSGDCKRSPLAYPVLDSQRIGATLTFVACSGATTSVVASDQVSALSADTNLVTISVGGNDVGFTEVISECALPSWAGDCLGAVKAARVLTKHVLPGSLDGLYGDIAAAAPNAAVVVVGYPRLFNGQNCSALTFFTPAEEAALNKAVNLVDRTIRARAHAAHFDYADPRKKFVGHAVCDAVPWINNLTSPIEESFHPNVLGQQAYADLVQPSL